MGCYGMFWFTHLYLVDSPPPSQAVERCTKQLGLRLEDSPFLNTKHPDFPQLVVVMDENPLPLIKIPNTEQNNYRSVGMFGCTHVGCIWLPPKPKRAGHWRLSSLIIDHDQPVSTITTSTNLVINNHNHQSNIQFFTHLSFLL